jgi:hypothetical protein
LVPFRSGEGACQNMCSQSYGAQRTVQRLLHGAPDTLARAVHLRVVAAPERSGTAVLRRRRRGPGGTAARRSSGARWGASDLRLRPSCRARPRRRSSRAPAR